MSLLGKQKVQDICEHTALQARKWSGFICIKRASEDTTLCARSTEERRMPNGDFYFGRSLQCERKLYDVNSYTHSIGNQP